VKILFVLASAEYLRYYDSTIALLASRGHHVAIAVNHDRGDKKPVRLEGLAAEFDNRVSVLGVVPAAEPFWGRVGRGLRGTMDFVRYLDPYFAHATALRARIRRKVLPRPLHGLDRIQSLGRVGTRLLVRVLALLERSIPTVAKLDRFLTAVAPDAIVVSPLVDAASPQVDIVKSAQRRGIPVAAGIASWDNLTNKGLLRIAPDLVLVWNDIQKREAVTLHGIPPQRVAVTGAQLFDRWFGRTPSRPTDEFCRMVGFTRTTPFLLFTCSSAFIAEGRGEVTFVRRWIESLRASGNPEVAAIPVLVRPHPYNTKAWAEANLSDLRDVVVWPRGAYNPVSEEARDGFFDSLYHSAAVVGINTSAMIEAAIVGRPVLSVRAPDFAATQEGTLHFHYLRSGNGGFVRVAEGDAEHAAQIAEVIANPDAARRETQRFVDSFIRPRGRDVAATPIVADALETLARQRVKRRGAGVAAMLRPAMWIVGAMAAASEASSSDGWHRARKAARMRWHRARKKMARITGAAAG
jgi:hypothetical protein